jgi:hypothetical protein
MTIFSTRNALVLSILFLSSCVSSKKERELLRVGNDDPINNVVKMIQDRCYQAKRPQFLADFSTESMLTPPFQMEGVWENNYNLLKASVIGPLGEEYLSFDIEGYNLHYNNQSNLLTSNDDFGSISSLLATIGAKGLRGFLCGQFAFQVSDKNDGVFIVIDKLNEGSLPELKQKTETPKSNDLPNKKYFTISTIDISGHNIEVQSNVSLTKKGNGYGVIVNSRFYYGLFSQDAQVEVKWVGFVNSTDVFPTSTVFRTKEDTYGVNFSEYQ